MYYYSRILCLVKRRMCSLIPMAVAFAAVSMAEKSQPAVQN